MWLGVYFAYTPHQSIMPDILPAGVEICPSSRRAHVISRVGGAGYTRLGYILPLHQVIRVYLAYTPTNCGLYNT